ncbi:hypothetical protein [Rhodococcus qingshengii]|uniref:hypothetical protein n=1 Tax=Rhodococcus qingshengii TaxID=334542 RepID=UPI0022B52DCB|nr:hypothetical protein [Rhodococcus qingshengii]MCZ4613334.1 hypothetical protein [Rhodococcus qingshengii]
MSINVNLDLVIRALDEIRTASDEQLEKIEELEAQVSDLDEALFDCQQERDTAETRVYELEEELETAKAALA